MRGLKKSAGLIEDIENPFSEYQEKLYESVKKTNKCEPIKMNKNNEFGLGTFVFHDPCYKEERTLHEPTSTFTHFVRIRKFFFFFSFNSQLNLGIFLNRKLFKMDSLTLFSKKCGCVNSYSEYPDTIYNSLVFDRERMSDKDSLKGHISS